MSSAQTKALLPAERQARLLARLERDGVVKVSELVADWHVSEATARRDIAGLAAAGRLHRVHGGAVFDPAADSRLEVAQPGRKPVGIGVLVPSLASCWLNIVQPMEAEAARNDLKIILRTSSYEAADERPIVQRLVADDGVEGLILAPRTDGPGAAALISWLIQSEIPTVLMEREARDPATHEMLESVTSDHALGTLKAVHHLATLGHRQVGLVMSRLSPTARKIAAGWRAACTELGLARNEHFEYLSSHRDLSHFEQYVAEVLDSVVSSGTTGLLVHSDLEALAVVQAAVDRGMRIPEDLSIIAYDDVMAGIGQPALTAIEPRVGAIAQGAIRHLVARMDAPESPVHRTQISPRLNIRDSTGPAPTTNR